MGAPRPYSPSPRTPLRGRSPERLYVISGAQNLSDSLPLLSAHWGLGEQKFLVLRLHFHA